MRQAIVAILLFLPVVAFAAFDRDLFVGVQSEAVNDLQQFLKNQGPDIYPEGQITGFFGPLTREAVKRFQARHGISQTGYFGSITRGIINELLEKPAAPEKPVATEKPAAPDTQVPVFLKTPRGITRFSEVSIVDAETDEPASYKIVCNNPIFSSPKKGRLVFEVRPHRHYTCQLTAEDRAGNASSKDLSFYTHGWFEVTSIEATSTPGLSVEFGTAILTNNSTTTLTLTTLPIKFGWLFSSATSSNIGALPLLLVKKIDGTVLSRNDFLIDISEKTKELKLNIGSIQLEPDSKFQLHLVLDELRVPLRAGDSLQIESASSTAPAEITPSLPQLGSVRFIRGAAVSIQSPPPAPVVPPPDALPLPAPPPPFVLTPSQILSPRIAPLPAPTSMQATFTRDLDVGSTGDEVSKLQEFLAADKILYPEGLITGYYGFRTAEAVKRFQARKTLPRVGRVGPATRLKLNEAYSSSQLPAVTTPPGALALPQAKPSPFKDDVLISSVAYREIDPASEHVIIRRVSSSSFSGARVANMDLSGWSIENNRGGRLTIPPALNIVFFDTASTNIKLPPGGEVVITSGVGYGSSFRENICTGYLAESNSFNPSLKETCPLFSLNELLAKQLNGACINVIERTRRCRQVVIGFEESAAGNACVEFSQEHLNYSGCVKDHRNSSSFFTDTWRVFLKQGSKFLDRSHDRVILRDKDGLIVDEYSY